MGLKMVFKDYYKILGLTRVTVTEEEIKLAYRNQAKKYHPDINKQSTGEIIKDINEAYKILSDKTKKKKYDKLWTSYVGKKKLENLTYEQDKKTENILDELNTILFGGVFSRNKKIEKKEDKSLNIEITLKISVKEAYLGAKKIIKLKDQEKELVINKNTKTNDVYILKYMGKKSEDVTKFPGDLYINIQVENDEKYTVKGLDVETKVFLSPAEMVMGTDVELEYFGEKIAIKVPPRTQNGKTFTLSKKGFSNNNSKGNLIIILETKIPQEISKEEEKLYKKILELE